MHPVVRFPPSRTTGAGPSLVLVGAAGALGAELVRRLVGRGAFARSVVVARRPFSRMPPRMACAVVPEGDPPTGAPSGGWRDAAADVAVVQFDPVRHEREAALWVPRPDALPALAATLRALGVTTLAVVIPHAQGTLPTALQSGLASHAEQAVAALGFERLLIVRAARPPGAAARRSAPARLANWMVGVARYMIPDAERPLRSPMLARFVDLALHALLEPGAEGGPSARRGTFIASAATVRAVATAPPAQAPERLARWLARAGDSAAAPAPTSGG